jgi:hypothetical protein
LRQKIQISPKNSNFQLKFQIIKFAPKFLNFKPKNSKICAKNFKFLNLCQKIQISPKISKICAKNFKFLNLCQKTQISPKISNFQPKFQIFKFQAKKFQNFLICTKNIFKCHQKIKISKKNVKFVISVKIILISPKEFIFLQKI